MAEAVYVLCALTSVACAFMLSHAYLRRSRSKLLLWSAICFGFLALNNILLVTDLIIFPTGIDLSLWRSGTSLAGGASLLYGLISESK